MLKCSQSIVTHVSVDMRVHVCVCISCLLNDLSPESVLCVYTHDLIGIWCKINKALEYGCVCVCVCVLMFSREFELQKCVVCIYR